MGGHCDRPFVLPLATLTILVYNVAMDTVRFSIELPADLVTWLDAEAEANQRSRNRQIVYILQTLKTQNETRRNMQDERWLDMQARKFPPGDRIG